MRRMCALILCPYLSFAAAQLNLTALPGVFPYSYAAIDQAGNIYLAGSTISPIPLVNPVQSTLSTGNCSEEAAKSFNPCPTAFGAKLDPTGSKILYSTYLGATQQYAASGLAVDAAGNAYISGTASAPSPLTPSGGQAFLFKVNPTGSARLRWDSPWIHYYSQEGSIALRPSNFSVGRLPRKRRPQIPKRPCRETISRLTR